MDTLVRQNSSSAATITLPERGRARVRKAYEVVAGALLAITGIGMILCIITNEALYPAARHYSTFANTISDLSGTEPPNSYMVQPNRLMFIVTMAVCGVLVLTATYLLAQVIDRRRFIVATRRFGVGLVGISVFPGNVAEFHPLFSLLCFLQARRQRSCPGRSWTHRWVLRPGPGVGRAARHGFRHRVAQDWGPQATIGLGGIERWIAYPVLLWLVLLGGAFMTRGTRIEN